MEIIQLILLALAAIIPSLAQSKVTTAYNKFSRVKNSSNLNGKQVARKILDKNNLSNVKIGEVSGQLTDHYNPGTKTVNLSSSIYNDTSIASLAVAAHECGHAIQHKENYSFLNFRTALVPVVNFTSRLSSILLLIGIFTGLTKLFTIGILMLAGGLLFQLITLPVEFNASNRALVQLEELGLVSKNDEQGAKEVLHAAALTYVAAFLSTALQILRLVMINRSNRR